MKGDAFGIYKSLQTSYIFTLLLANFVDLVLMIIGFGMSIIYAFTSKLLKLIVIIMIKNNSFLFYFILFIIIIIIIIILETRIIVLMNPMSYNS